MKRVRATQADFDLLDEALANWQGFQLPDGLGKKENVSPDDFDLDELAVGVRVELEHTDKPELALEIALSHLAEHPDYYTRLFRAKL